MKRMTNKQLVKQMMESYQTGALQEVFVLEAIRHYSELILQDQTDWGNSFISKDAWQMCARECLVSLEAANQGQSKKRGA